MQRYHQMYNTQQGFARQSSLVTIVIMIALLAFVISKLPQGYSNDISKIGKGTNVTVLVHNKGDVSSLNTMALLDGIRNDYSGQIEFLVMDIETPEGKIFTQQQQIYTSALVLFSPEGKRIKVLMGIKDADNLRIALEQTFHISQ